MPMRSSDSADSARPRFPRKALGLLIGAIVGFALTTSAQITIPFPNFTSGTVADPSQVNSNFSTVGNQALNRTGGTMTGTLTAQTITVASDATYDLGPDNTHRFRNENLSGTLNVGGATTLTGGVASSFSVTGTVTATQFSGSGATLTGIPLTGLAMNVEPAWNIIGKTANYTANFGDLIEILANQITVTLPAASTCSVTNYIVGIKNDTPNVQTVARNGADTIDYGVGNFSTSGIQYESYDFICNANHTGWLVR